MSAEATIVNIALVHAAVGKTIVTLDDQTETARAAKKLWDPVMQELQRERKWNFNEKVGILSPVGADPTIAYSTKWARAYRYLADCLFVRGIIPPRDDDGTIQELSVGGRIVEIPFAIRSDTLGQLILTNQGPGAECVYSFYHQAVELWPADFKMTASLRLGAYLSVALGKGDEKKIGERSFRLFEASLYKASATDAQEGVQDNSEDTDMIRSRG
jgi:hypothetical protein